MRVLSLAVVLFWTCGIAFAEPVVPVRNNGPVQNRINMVVLGDGYTKDQMLKYSTDVDLIVNAIFHEQPFAQYERYFNVFRIDVVSNESGADHPERQQFRDTALGAAYNCQDVQRLICVDLSKVSAVLTRSVPADSRDLVIVLVNDSEYGGSGGSVTVASTNEWVVDLVLHETGHTLGLLADEYDYSPPSCSSDVEPSQPNATRDASRSSIKWGIWVDGKTPLPTRSNGAAVPGAYEGARYCQSGLYRPTYNSKMRSVGKPYEQINSEQLVLRFHNFVSPIDSASATLSNDGLHLLVDHPRQTGRNLQVKWRLDGRVIGSTAQVSWPALNIAPGTHAVEVEVRDTNPVVRRDPKEALVARQSWTLSVGGYVRQVSFQASNGQYVSSDQNGGGSVTADRRSAGSWERFYLIDANRGQLKSGDIVYIETSDEWYFQAEGGGGAALSAIGRRAGPWESFTIVSDHDTIRSGDAISLQASSGHYVKAEGGGGGKLTATAPSAHAWEKFTITIR